MNYINKDERVKARRQFILLFSLAVILTVTVASAFFIPSGFNQPKEQPGPRVVTTINNQPDTIIKEILIKDTASQKLALALQKKLDEKNGQVIRLQQQVSSLQQVSRQPKSNPGRTFNEISFLKLALRSQTSLVEKLKRENEQLKQKTLNR